MAFQFPDPAVTTTVVNPETGITYQWKADPGKWVITTGEPEDDGCVSTTLTFVASSAQEGEFHNRNNAGVDDFYVRDKSWVGLIDDFEKVTLYIDGVEYLEVEIRYQYNSSGDVIATYFIMPLGTAPDFVVGEKYKFSYCPPVYPTGEFAPFTSSYRCVHPDDYTGEDGTCYGKTDAYINNPEYAFANGSFVEWEFASKDLNGGATFNDAQGSDVAFDYVFDPVNPGTFASEQFGTFVITARKDYRKYGGYVEYGANMRFAENSIVYIRNPSQSPSQQPYVKKTGDTMTGPLVMEDADEIKMQNTQLDFVRKGESLKDANGDPVLDADGNEQWDDQVDRFSTIESMTPRLLKNDGTITQDTSTLFGIDIDLSSGNTYKNTLQASAKEGWIFRIAGGGTPTITFNDVFDLTKNSTYDIDNGVAIRGIPTPGDNTPSDFAVNKDYVDTKDENLRQDIIELEEELEAIAPSLERGTWLFNPIGAAGVGQYGLFALGTSTDEYPQADHLFINSVDSTGKVHNFDDVGEGAYLEIFTPDDSDYGLYQVIENNGETQGANSYWDFALNHLQSNRLTASAEGVCRFKFFELAEGADPETFVLRRGDTMTGNLKITVDPDSSDEKAAALVLEGRRTTATQSCATVSFRNENVTEETSYGYLTYLNYNNNQYFQFNKNVKVNGNLTATNELRGTVLNSAEDSNLSIQRNDETKILVGSDAVQVQRPIKFVNSSFATEDDHAIHKGYVDEQIANISGGGINGDCLEINGGKLCAGGPIPEWIELVKNNKIIRSLNGLQASTIIYGPIDDTKGVRYIVKSGNNDLYEIPLQAGTDWSQGVKTNLRSNNVSDVMSVSPKGTYVAVGHFKPKVNGNYTYKDWEISIARTSDWQTTLGSASPGGTTGNVKVNGQISWYSETQFVVAAWAHGSSSSSKYKHAHLYGEITDNNGDFRLSLTKKEDYNVTGIYSQDSSADFHYTCTANDQILLLNGTDGRIFRLKDFTKNYSDWELVHNIGYVVYFIAYYPELQRYYWTNSSTGIGYLSQPTTDPISANTFVNPIVFDFPNHVFSNGTTYSNYPKISPYYFPLVYGTKLIVPSSHNSYRTINGVQEYAYDGYFVYEGGNSPGTLYKGDPDNQMKDGYDYNRNQHHYTFVYSFQAQPDKQGFSGGTNILTQYGYDIETDVPQPYIHDLTWNGVSVLNETYELNFQDYPELPEA